MLLSSGMRLGPYEITGALGAGGMGEVYRATDTKLGRDVAIKTLPAALASDVDRLARFEREAKLLAALHHPHIAGVYGLDEHDGTPYLAMELIEGETLEGRLARGTLPVDDALRFALQIADALEAAHSKGVVHRDLKPANVMLTSDGQVKVLDFGLAKAVSDSVGEASAAHSSTSLAMTQQGLVLGTAGYMSPEQASGQGTDQRSDVWAFGVVLYEMLASRQLFRGESVPHILAEVLKTEPDWSRLPKPLHPRLRFLLERCLAKKPRNRLHSIADARIELEAVLGDPAGAIAASSAQPVARPKPAAVRSFAAMAATAAIAAAAVWFLRPNPEPPPRSVARLSFELPPNARQLAPTSMIAVSPDGQRIAFARDQLYLRELADSDLRPVPGTAGAVAVTEPAFSPDGRWLAYVHIVYPNGPFVVKRVPISGGSALSLHTAANASAFPHGLSWPTPEALLFANDQGVVRLPANGGAVEVLVQRRETERLYSPQWLPGRDAVLFTSVPGLPSMSGGYDAAELAMQSIGHDDRTVIWRGGAAARYVPTGHLLYAQGTSLFGIAFDVEARSPRGGPVQLAQGLARSGTGFSDAANFTVAENGTLVRIPFSTEAPVGAGPRIQTTLAWVDRAGREEPLAVRPDDYTAARISPDGTKIALVVGAPLVREVLPTIWIYDLRSENLSLLATDPMVHDGPVWSVDGRRIYFRGYGFENPSDVTSALGASVYAIELETREVELVGKAAEYSVPRPWEIAPDGDTLAIVNPINLEDVDLATLSLSRREFAPLIGGPGLQNQLSFSPNGAWVAYSETRPGGVSEINLRPYPAVSRTLIPIGAGDTPIFSHDGSELFLHDGSGIAAAPVSYEPTLRVGAPRRLFESDAYLGNLQGRTWDPAPSGERFLMIRAPDDSSDAVAEREPLRVEVVLNWLEELKTRVPTGR